MSGWGCQSAPKHSQDFSWSFQGDSPKNTISHKLFITILHHQQKNPNHLTTKKLNFWRIYSAQEPKTQVLRVSPKNGCLTLFHTICLLSAYIANRESHSISSLQKLIFLENILSQTTPSTVGIHQSTCLKLFHTTFYYPIPNLLTKEKLTFLENILSQTTIRYKY